MRANRGTLRGEQRYIQCQLLGYVHEVAQHSSLRVAAGLR